MDPDFSIDPRLRVVEHPRLGKTLVAKEDIPKGCTFYWWGQWLDGCTTATNDYSKRCCLRNRPLETQR